jgi:hypothetical protein
MKRLMLPAALCVAALTACGSSGDNDHAPTPRGPASAELRRQLETATHADPEDFPVPRGKTLRELADSLDGTGPQLAFATQTLVPGEHQRLAFGLIDPKTGFVYAPTAVYLARSERERVQGPYGAPADLLVTDPAFRSQTAASESDTFAAVYETTVPLGRAGRYLILAVAHIKGQLIGAGGSIRVISAGADRIPDIGERAPAIDTDTVAAAGGNIKAIDTRIPPDDMHDVSFKDVGGKKPVALLFATPQLCQSRVCGPVVDIAAQLKKTYGGRMTLIHQEVYVDNEANKGLRPQLRAFHLQTEPWLFVFDRTGRITTRMEGSFGFNAFERAVRSGLR